MVQDGAPLCQWMGRCTAPQGLEDFLEAPCFCSLSLSPCLALFCLFPGLCPQWLPLLFPLLSSLCLFCSLVLIKVWCFSLMPDPVLILVWVALSVDLFCCPIGPWFNSYLFGAPCHVVCAHLILAVNTRIICNVTTTRLMLHMTRKKYYWSLLKIFNRALV